MERRCTTNSVLEKKCCVKDEETPCGRNSQNIFKVVLNTTKNTHIQYTASERDLWGII